jgi:hypothetical protein
MKVLNIPVAIDDYGNSVFLCHYTGVPVSIGDHIYIGPCIPQLSGTYVCAQDAHAWFRDDKYAFDESEANCNTCVNFGRLPHPKSPSGFLRGQCSYAPAQHPLLYVRTNADFWIHPDDRMGMSCYTPRTKKLKPK